MPADAVDVANALRFAARHGLRVAPQRTGHNAGPLGDLEDVLLLKTDALDGVEIDAGARRVRVGAATRWEQVTPRLSELGLAALHGSSPDVGIVGYSLGGGIGWLARKHGMQTNAVTAIELVTADGQPRPHRPRARARAVLGPARRRRQFRRRDRDRVRGPCRCASSTRARCSSPLEQTADVLHAWTELLPRLPEEITSWANVLHFPPLPELPEAIRGRSFAVVMAAFLGSEADGRELLRPLRRLGPGWTRSRCSRRSGSASWRWTRASRCPSGAPTR